MFRNTSINKVIQICTLMKKEKFSKDQYIFRKGSIADKFYIIIQRLARRKVQRTFRMLYVEHLYVKLQGNFTSCLFINEGIQQPEYFLRRIVPASVVDDVELRWRNHLSFRWKLKPWIHNPFINAGTVNTSSQGTLTLKALTSPFWGFVINPQLKESLKIAIFQDSL